MLCDELKEYTSPTYGSSYYDIDEVDAAIAELKDKCQMHDFFWEGCGFAKRGFKNTIAVSEAFDRLEAENAELKKKLMPCLNGDCIEAVSIIRHSNHKRCLAMAEWCKESLRLMRTYEVTDDYWELEPGHDAEYFCKKGDFYSKWRKRWLALAEEPTWAKFLQLIHKEAK